MNIYRTRSDHDWLVGSESVQGKRYEVTRHSCNCPGFNRYGGKPGWTCKHVRAVREVYGNPMVRFPQRPAVVVGDSGEAA